MTFATEAESPNRRSIAGKLTEARRGARNDSFIQFSEVEWHC